MELLHYGKKKIMKMENLKKFGDRIVPSLQAKIQGYSVGPDRTASLIL
jgi:hypothetical protein